MPLPLLPPPPPLPPPGLVSGAGKSGALGGAGGWPVGICVGVFVVDWIEWRVGQHFLLHNLLETRTHAKRGNGKQGKRKKNNYSPTFL